ncbi:MAG: hypothetical protein U0263_27250 [Polyangiaceae bacterium]
MRDRLRSLIDKPVTIRTVPDDPVWKPTSGVVFDVSEDAVDVLIGSSVMKTVRIATIIDVSIDERHARDMLLEDPPEDPSYALGKRKLFEADQAQYLAQPPDRVTAAAAEACGYLRRTRTVAPSHLGTELLLERAHHLATGRWDYECDPSATGGELANHNYRFAKARASKLNEALELRRPEDEVASHVAAIGKWTARALAKYPNHGELRQWRERAESIRKKLSEDVRRANALGEPLV